MMRCSAQNLKVVSQYYVRCELKRMAELFEISVEDTEEQLCEMVENGRCQAKIDRPSGIVVFGVENSKDKMTEWSRSISR